MTKNVLFLCIGNSARGLIAEALMTKLGNGLFKGYSAGAHPGALINPFASELIHDLGYPLSELRCKRWDEFAGEDVIALDFVITLCPEVKQLEQPAWKGNPLHASWEIEDPTATTGTVEEIRRVFKQAFLQLEAHIDLFMKLPFDHPDPSVLQDELRSLSLHLNENRTLR